MKCFVVCLIGVGFPVAVVFCDFFPRIDSYSFQLDGVAVWIRKRMLHIIVYSFT